jgi:CBS domain-containing membrane protein
MLAHRRFCLPVLEDGHLAGIFTATDALRFAVGLLEREARQPGPIANVSRLMTIRPLATVQPATVLADAWELMRSAGVRHLPVADAGSIVGILCDRDVLAASRASPETLRDQPTVLVADAMSPRVVTIQADRPALDAARMLLRRRLGALPVLRGSELLGMITVSDFLYWITSCD